MSEEIYFEPCRLSAEESLCLTDRNETRETGCIGHMRGDFGGGGKAFHSRWSDHLCADRNDELFKAVFGKLIDTLREKDNLLSCRTALYNNCISHPEWEEKRMDSRRFWKFRYLTRDYAFYFRCTPSLGEDNFCVYAYDREKLFARMAKERDLLLYCYGYLPTTNEVIRIDFGEMGYCPIKVMKTGRSEAAEMNREIGVTPAQAEAMKAGSMFGWMVPAAFPERYDEIGRAKREREVR